MKRKPLFASALFAAVALAHVARILFGVHVTIADQLVPMWASVVVGLFAAVAAVVMWSDARADQGTDRK